MNVFNVFKECLGYVGMLFVILSFLFKDIKWLRLFNVIGSILSAIYGFLTRTYPTAILNCILFLVNIVYLVVYSLRGNKNDKNNSI